MQGYIKIWRKLQETSFYKDSEAVHLAVHLIMNANHKDGKFMFNGRMIEIKRGSFLTGLHALNKATGISIQKLRTRLTLLEKEDFLTSKVTNKFRIINVCNYETYQGSDKDDNKQNNKQITNKQQTDNKQITTNKNDKNVKNDKNDIEEKKPKRKKSDILPVEEYKDFVNEKMFEILNDTEFIERNKKKRIYANIDFEISEAHEWLLTHTDKKGQRRNLRGFLNNWFSKANRDAKESGKQQNFIKSIDVPKPVEELTALDKKRRGM